MEMGVLYDMWNNFQQNFNETVKSKHNEIKYTKIN